MAYQTGVASTAADLLSSLLSFCEDNGFEIGPTWTFEDQSVWPYLNWTARSLVKDGNYFTFAMPPSGNGRMQMNQATSLAGSGPLQVQPGAFQGSNSDQGSNCQVSYLQGPFVGYHFFSDDESVHVAVEVVTNVFTHFNFGVMQKNGNWAGGQFVTGLGIYNQGPQYLNNPFSYHNLPFDGCDGVGNTRSDNNIGVGNVRTPVGSPVELIAKSRAGSSSRVYCTPWASNAGRPLLDRSPNKFNGRAVLVPINFVQASSGDQGPYYQLGTIGNARAVNIANLNPKELVNGDWMVFPLCQKNGPGTTYLNSLNYGLAYRK